MKPSDKNSASAKQKNRAAAYNQALTVFWSIPALAPIGYFCYSALALKEIYLFLAISLPVILLPSSFYDAIQWSKKTSFYEAIGIRIVKKLTQDGDWINRLIRKKLPGYQVFDSRRPPSVYLKKAYMIEKIHTAMLLFFGCSTIAALIKGYTVWAVLLTLTNLVFNVYPNLLQQYNRLRLRQILKR